MLVFIVLFEANFKQVLLRSFITYGSSLLSPCLVISAELNKVILDMHFSLISLSLFHVEI